VRGAGGRTGAGDARGECADGRVWVGEHEEHGSERPAGTHGSRLDNATA
jgi:hypothetical protein